MIIRWDSESIEPLMREIEEWEMDRSNSQNPQKGCWQAEARTTFLLSCPPLHALLQSPRSIHRCLRILSKMKLDFNIIAPIWTNHRMSKEMSFTSVCKAATRLGASWLKVSSAQGVFYRSELWDLSGRWALDHTTTRSTKVAAKMMLMHFGEIMHQLKAVTQAPEHLDPAVQRAHDFMNWKQDAKRCKNRSRSQHS